MAHADTRQALRELACRAIDAAFDDGVKVLFHFRDGLQALDRRRERALAAVDKVFGERP